MSTVKEVVGYAKNIEEGEAEELGDVEKLLYSSLVYGTKASNSLPGENEDFDYYATLPEFKAKIDQFRHRIVTLIHKFASRVDSSDELFKLHELIDADPADFATFEPVADIVDLLLENVDSYLDEASGAAKKNMNANAQVAVSKSELVRDVRSGLQGVVTHDANIARPQQTFTDTIDNSRAPFVPKLREKPHAIEPFPKNGLKPIMPEDKDGRLESLYQKDDEGPVSENLNLVEAHVRSLGVDIEKHSQPRYPNPYETEIRAALASPPSWMFQKCEPLKYAKLEETAFNWVNSVSQLKKLCNELEEEIEVAVDLENHSYRSFQGFVCLMQVSTRRADYIVDTLALREHMHLLNKVFSNPAIVKIFHGSDSDILWLQRDFGIYVVSLFDTGQAARVLGYPSAGLAFALKHHCNVKVNKAFQLADWRMRPLSEEMLTYAREDTHYLLYVYDKMRNELLDKIYYSQNRNSGDNDQNSLLWKVLRKSASIALNTYEKDFFTPSSYRKLIQRKNLVLSMTQERALARLYNWRDSIARKEDESVQYILPQRILLRIVRDLPRSAVELENCCNPIPPAVKLHCDQILDAIKTGVSDDSTIEDSFARDMKIESGGERPNEVPTLSSVKPELQASTSVPSTQTSSLGVNSLRTTFVPISANVNSRDNRNTPKMSFAAATRAGIKDSESNTLKNHAQNRKGALKVENTTRATPSPVLTTEQLYDTAGWQDESSSAVPVVRVQNLLGFSLSSKVQTNQSEENRKIAEDVRAEIGKGLHTGFSAVQPKTPFAAMAKAMVNSYNKDSTGKLSSSETVKSANTSSNTERKDTVAEDDVIDIDTPANADALESDDIPRSMAEIYRISNRNRKRNKEKKKLKEEVLANKDDVDESHKQISNAHSVRKRQKNTGQGTGSTKELGTQEAIEFMRNIGWVSGEEKPVANLIVQGAPEQPSHLAGAIAPNEHISDGGHGGRQGSSKGQRHYQSNSSKTRGRHGGSHSKNPGSPRRRQTNRGQGGNSSQHHGGNKSHSSNRHRQGGQSNWSDRGRHRQ